MTINNKFKNEVKREIGLTLAEMRRRRGLLLKDIVEQTNLDWQVIDKAESGNVCGWPAYRRLLDFYDKEIKVELVDKPAE